MILRDIKALASMASTYVIINHCLSYLKFNKQWIFVSIIQVYLDSCIMINSKAIIKFLVIGVNLICQLQFQVIVLFLHYVLMSEIRSWSCDLHCRNCGHCKTLFHPYCFNPHFFNSISFLVLKIYAIENKYVPAAE